MYSVRLKTQMLNVLNSKKIIIMTSYVLKKKTDWLTKTNCVHYPYAHVFTPFHSTSISDEPQEI